MSEQQEHVVHTEHPGPGADWWCKCSCGARWRIPVMVLIADMQKEVQETTLKHKAYFNRPATGPD